MIVIILLETSYTILWQLIFYDKIYWYEVFSIYEWMNVICFFMYKTTYLHTYSIIFLYIDWVWEIESDVQGGGEGVGLYELPPSCSWPYLV